MPSTETKGMSEQVRNPKRFNLQRRKKEKIFTYEELHATNFYLTEHCFLSYIGPASATQCIVL